MVKPLLIATVFASCVGCQAVGHPLTAAEVTRIADAKARSYRADIIEFEHLPPSYDASDDSWWVRYRQKKAGHVDFGVRVEAKTKKAWLVSR
ncbi:MAG: hypothetical protein ABR611_15765 [Chthoniobacterales bacterium]